MPFAVNTGFKLVQFNLKICHGIINDLLVIVIYYISGTASPLKAGIFLRYLLLILLILVHLALHSFLESLFWHLIPDRSQDCIVPHLTYPLELVYSFHHLFGLLNCLIRTSFSPHFRLFTIFNNLLYIFHLLLVVD